MKSIGRQVAAETDATSAKEQPMLSRARRRSLSQFLTQAVERRDVPGVVAVIVNQDGVLFEGAAGKLTAADDIDMPTNAIFRIASMTKPITSVAMLMLVEEGRLAMDEPVSKYLPRFHDARVIVRFDPADGGYETRKAKRAITIRHLLTHTSGIGYGFSSPVLFQLLQGAQVSELDLPLLHEPGDRWTYGAGTLVLGMVIEKVAGQTLDRFFMSRIFEPLGMVDTSFGVRLENAARVVSIHRRTGKQVVEQANPTELRSSVRGDGGLFSTARDYGTFVRMILNGGKLGNVAILSPESVAAMGENQIGELVVEEQPAAKPASAKAFPLGAGRDKFGLGFQIAEPDERYAGLRSPGSLSWAGIYNTHFWIDPKRGLGGVVLMQVLPFYDDAAVATLRGFEEVVYSLLA